MNTIIALSILAVSTMFIGVFNHRRVLLPVIIVGLLVALGLNMYDWGEPQSHYYNMVVTDRFSSAFGSLLIATTLMVLLIPSSYYQENESHLEAVYSIMVFSLLGGLIMISAANLVTFFIGLEVLSISLYLLAASHRSSVYSTEAGMKYFIMGSFASAFLLFGIALLFGATGSLSYSDILNYINIYPGTLPPLLKAGIILTALGMAFKVAAAPFHFWAPDVYHGSPTVITAYMITAVKVAGFAAFLRLTLACFGSDTSIWAHALSVIAALSILAGNLFALAQSKTKRMMAYSSIAHTGYLLLALVSLRTSTPSLIFYYGVAYILANLVFFIAIIQLKSTIKNTGFEAFNGLAKHHPLVALSVAIALLSFTGIPPMAGFMGKYLVFTSAIEGGFLWLVLIAIAGSAISIAYYFKPLINMYMKPADEMVPTFSKGMVALMVGLSALTLVAGLLPRFFLLQP